MHINIYEFIELERKKRNLMKKDIINILGFDQKTGYKYLCGERRIRRKYLLQLLIYFEIDYITIQKLLLTNKYPLLYSGDKDDICIIEISKSS